MAPMANQTYQDHFESASARSRSTFVDNSAFSSSRARRRISEESSFPVQWSR